MSVELAVAVWEELKRYVGPLDRSEAADAMVNLLIDSNFDSDEIREAFRGEIGRASCRERVSCCV